MAKPAAIDITLIIGDDETVQVTICSDAAGAVPVDINGRTYEASIAATPGGAVVDTFTTAVSGDGSTGVVTLTLTDTETAALTAGVYSWDLVETNGTAETTLILGYCTIQERVTV